ncbi:response regulator transcription factor [Agromyces sp. C10]|uniref:response regulator n=1 Tax=Agromyces sp. C10 TaxID=2935077 RepID=UPI00200A049A|nr:response regulator transcription factor [Agromyces sp. C10]MCK8609863.1 response regulator transcription factor [Agromyces sp. C10]
MIRVILADDHELLRSGLVSILESEPEIRVIAVCADGPSAVRESARLRPDLVLMDVEMPGGDGISAIAPLLEASPETRVMVLTLFDLDEYVAGALRAGASGFLIKTTPPRELIAAVKTCAAGEATFGPSVMARLVQSYIERPDPANAPAGAAELTSRELEVLRQMARGLSNAEIGRELHLAETTVKSHVAHVLLKLGVRDRVQAVVVAHTTGMLG